MTDSSPPAIPLPLDGPPALDRLAAALRRPAWLVAAAAAPVLVQRRGLDAGELVVRVDGVSGRLTADCRRARTFAELVEAARRAWPAPDPEERPDAVAIELDDAAAGEFLDRLPVLLARAAEDPEARPWTLPLLDGHEVAARLAALRGQRAPAPAGEATVPELVAERAAAAPDAPAVRHGETVMTYRDLDVTADRLAAYLAALGAGPGERVVLCLPRSAGLVTAALAVMRCGAAYTPVDPGQPAARLGLMVADSSARVLVAGQALLDRLPDVDIEVVALDATLDLLARRRAPAPRQRPRPSPSLPAYVIYTSGSTGVPKGTVLTHATLGNYCRWHRRRYALTAADRMAMLVSPAFDVSVAELWPALTAGACLEVVDDERRLDPAALWEWFDERETTIMFAPTPLAEAFLARESSPRALRCLIAGGDRLRRRPRPGHRFEVSNVYGPAEATVGTTEGRVEPERDGAPLPGIGRAIANVELRVVDGGGSLLPAGFPGELCIGGAGVGLGYLQRPALTAERYVPDPFAAAPGARMYRTGDLARAGADGELEYLGRMDHQVKIRGFRVELGEVEAVLAAELGFEEVVVTAPEHAELGRRLVAYVVAGARPVPDLATVRERAGRRLPDYMLPSALVALEALPLSGSGKIDRAALPAPDAFEAAAEPMGDLEGRIAAVWGEVLGLQRVRAEDNFFALGGHSLLVVEVTDRLAEDLGIEVELTTLLEHPTVTAFAAALRSAGGERSRC